MRRGYWLTRKRMPRFASLTWNEKAQKLQLRLGTPAIVHSWDASEQKWAMVWARALSKAEHLPLKLVIPESFPQPELDVHLRAVRKEIPGIQLQPDLQMEIQEVPECKTETQ